MIKKKAKGNKRTGKKTAQRKKNASKAENKDLNPSEVRKDIAAMVKAEAQALAGAVIGEGKKGQLATVKYLFEMAQIYPELLTGEDGGKGEKSLAETLLDSLGIPKDPVIHDMYEKGEDIVIAPRREVPSASPESTVGAKTEEEKELVAAE